MSDLFKALTLPPCISTILLTIFKPKPECFSEFVEALKEHSRDRYPARYIMTREDEVVSVTIRDADKLEKSAKDGVNWLDQQRHLLQEFNDMDKHTIFMTGDLVED